MALTPEQEARLAELDKKFGQQKSLSPDQEARFAELDAKFNPKPQQEQTPIDQPGLISQIGQGALEQVAKAGELIDRYSGAPVRAAIGAAQEGNNPLTAYASQFGRPTETAPTGSQIAQKMGITDQPIFDPTRQLDKQLQAQGFSIQQGGNQGISPADVVGLGINVVADPLTFIPISKIAKGVGGAGEFGLSMAAKTTDKALKGSAKAADVLSGTQVASKAYTGVKEAAKGAGRVAGEVSDVISNFVTPKIANDFESLKKIAEKNGIDPTILPESVEFGKDSFISRASRAKAEGPLGQKLLEKHAEAQAQIANAFDSKIKDISGVGGALTHKDAGSLIRTAYDEGVDRFFNQMDTTYNSLANKFPNLKLDKASSVKFNDALSEIQANALKRYRNPINAIEKAEAGNILQTVDTILKNKEDFKSSVDLLQRIGKYNFKPSTLMSSPIDAAANRKLYGQLKETIMRTVEKVDPKAAIDLADNNKALTEFFGEQSSLSKTLGSKTISDEGIFKNLIENGDSKKIDALQSVLSPEQMAQLKATFMDTVTKRGQDGSINYLTTQNALKNKSSIASQLFSPEELSGFGELLELGKRTGAPIMSSSGTGASNMFKDLARSVPDAIVSDKVIESMKARARGQGLKGMVDDLKGLTNEEVSKKISKNKNLKEIVSELSKKNIRSKSAQTYSATKDKEK